MNKLNKNDFPSFLIKLSPISEVSTEKLENNFLSN